MKNKNAKVITALGKLYVEQYDQMSVKALTHIDRYIDR